MREIAIALGIAAGLVSLAFMGRMPFEHALLVGGWMIGGGLLVGVPAGVVYHFFLHRELSRASGVPRGWIWRPTELHGLVPENARRVFLPWFWIGAAACGVIFFGCAVVFIAAVGETIGMR